MPQQFAPDVLLQRLLPLLGMETPQEQLNARLLLSWIDDPMIAARRARLELPWRQPLLGATTDFLVLGAFIFVAFGGMRFNTGVLGAWYAAESPETSFAEVGHHMRRRMRDQGLRSLQDTYNLYTHRLDGDRYEDVRRAKNGPDELYHPGDYSRSQHFGESARQFGRDGIIYDSVRRPAGVCIVAYRPSNVRDIQLDGTFAVAVVSDSTDVEATEV